MGLGLEWPPVSLLASPLWHGGPRTQRRDMAHFGSGKFWDKVTFFVRGKLPFSCPTSPVRTSLGKSPLVNGVEMCVSGRLSLPCFTAGANHREPPTGRPTSLTGSVPTLTWPASLQLLGWGGRPGIFVWIFQARSGSCVVGHTWHSSELHKNNQLLTVRCLGLSICALSLRWS